MTDAKRRHGGVLVHCQRDAEGLVEVVETHGVRSLHFGSSPRQSAMALDEPDRLELSYVRAMLAGLVYAPEPRRAEPGAAHPWAGVGMIEARRVR